jgi:hypothetical protein
VTERDAFGNPIEPTTPATTATPVSAAPPTPLAPMPGTPLAPTPAPAAPALEPASIAFGTAVPTIPAYGPSKTSWWERLAGLAVFLVFAAPLAVGGYFAYTTFHTAKDAVEGVSIKSVVGTPTTTTGPRGAKPAAPLPNMLNAKSLRGALAATKKDPGGRLTLLRVAPERADLQLARKGGGLTIVQRRADGGTSVIRTPGTPNKTIGFARVDVKAPSRLVRRAAHRLGRSTKSIDYVVLINVLDGPRWSAYFKGGAAFQGDVHGRIVRRIS